MSYQPGGQVRQAGSIKKMRITGGRAKGILLKAPNSPTLRPAMDRMRQAVFSSLGPVVSGVHVLDLFAGTGSYGLEALSRGAQACIFVEKDPRCIQALRENVKIVAKSMRCENPAVTVICRDVLKWRMLPEQGADLIFVDPPYSMLSLVEEKLRPMLATWIKPHQDARLIVEMQGDQEFLPDGFSIGKRLGRGRKDPTVAIYRWSG